MQTFISLLVVIILILINAFFSGTEMAVITLNDAKIRKMAEDGHKRAKLVLNFIDSPSNFLATIQVGVTFAGFLSSAFAASSFAGKLALLIDPDSRYGWLPTVCTVGITLVLSYFSLVFGELVPKRLAMKNPEGLALSMSGVLSFFSRLFAPVAWLLSISTNGVLRLCGVIDWSWVWVLAPIWVPICLWLLAVLIAFIVAARKRR